MNISVRVLESDGAALPFLTVALFESATLDQPILGNLDSILGGVIKTSIENEDFAGKNGETLDLYSNSGQFSRVILVGLGKQDKVNAEGVRRAFGSAGKKLRAIRQSEAGLVMPFEGSDSEELFARAAIEGFALATWRYARFMTKKPADHPALETLTLFASSAGAVDKLQSSAQMGEATVAATVFARDLATTPAADLRPSDYAEHAKLLAIDSDVIEAEVLDYEKLVELKMGGIVGVGKGSSDKPCLIHLTYTPPTTQTPKKTIAVVGKGITFDSGGYDLKPAASMRDMKIDMSGSAAVMGLFKALELIRPNVKVEGFIPAAENMVSDDAYRPGDVLTMYNGLTVEIDNTDAEGRLVLADALAYAVETIKPDTIVDIATLTGACWIGLGVHATGMFGTDDNLKTLLREAGEKTGERVWELPIWDDYRKQLKSQIADFKNTGGRPGGAITAAAFLSEFVGKTPWIHLDIAGTSSEVSTSYVPHKEFPTGVGARLLLETIMTMQ